MKTKRLFLATIFLVMITAFQLSGCDHKEKEQKLAITESTHFEQPQAASVDESQKGISKEEKTESDKKDATVKGKDEVTNSPQADNEQIPQKVIKSADVSFKVEKYDVARTKILAIIKNHKAYVSSENQTGDEYRTSNVMVVRVGSTDFDALIEDLLQEAVFVDYKKINAEDVTEEYVDISARLKSKKDALTQYEIILKQAKTIADILEVQQYIRTLQEEIESIEGRLKYLNNKVELSTINLTFYMQGKIMPMQSETFGYKVRQAISYGWQGLISFLIGVTYLWPLWIISLAIFFLIRHLIKRANRKRAEKLQQ